MRSPRNPGRAPLALGLCVVLMAGGMVSQVTVAQDVSRPATPSPAPLAAAVVTPVPDAEADSLPVRQDILGRRYKRFEDTLLKLSESLRKTDPERADLLRRAISKSKESLLAPQLAELVELLKKNQLGEALDRQQAVVAQMQTLLDLLLSEDRAKELIAERKRIEGYLKDLKSIIAGQKETRAGTERGDPIDDLSGRQRKIADKTNELGKKIDRDDASKNEKPGDEKPGESKPGESKPGESKPGESKPGESKPGESKPGESKPGESKPGESKPGESKPGESKPGESKPGKSTPGRENLEQAQREMEKALKKLKNSDRQQASNDQEEAIRELQKAKDKLEEILRQLREEERLKLLAALEARFQRMLAMQLQVYDGTLKLAKVAVADRNSGHSARSLQLARQEEEIVVEANKAITLLKEDGTAVAFPEAAEQMRDDMQQVVTRLERADVAELTQSIEKDIISALEEMIEALQKEMEKRDQQKQQNQQNQQQQQQQEEELIEQLAELKMLRSLQLRINHRTKRIGRMVQGEQATDGDLVQQLQILGGRQSRVQQATFNLATGRNK